MEAGAPGGPPERPDYKVYRSRRGPFGKLRAPDLSSLRDRMRRRRKPEQPPDQPPGALPPKRKRPTWVRVLGWIGVAVLGWILISLLAFAISAQIQKGKLADGASDPLGGNPVLAASPQTILVLGTDVRPPGLAGPESEIASEECTEAATSGEAPPSGCSYRADTILLVRAGGGTFRQLSIPRDSQAEIPGHGIDKINAAYAFGGAELQIETVEQFLGLDVDEVANLDFNGFRDLIDTLGGIEVELDQPVCSEISGGEELGGFTLDLDAGTHELDADEALSLARTRSSGDCDDDGIPDGNLSDLDRAGFQQVVLDGIRSRITDPTRVPINLLKGPIIGWNAPKAMISSMGGLTMPQLVFALGIGGDDGSEVLEPQALAEPLVIPQDECERKVEEFLGGEPPRTPACSPGG